ncbi:MAG: DHH family phosphoesterase [Clostridia bacterium]|nr:DHH family phosphoesterase [Clostridia bacterium]
MQLTYSAFHAYLTTCRRDVADARLFVLGHPAPDGDAVLSSLFEGWRRTLSGTPAVPVVQADSLPREVAFLLGALAPLVLTASEAATGLICPDSRFVLTDHHVSPYLPRTVGVVDHHPVSPATNLAGMDVRIRPVGAATTLVAMALKEAGLTPDAGVARLLLGGIMLDTDGLSPHKAKTEDVTAAVWLSPLCGEDPAAFYDVLQQELLSETDVTVLYRRDFREYPRPDGRPGVGFAILKAWRESMPDREAVRRLLAEDVRRGGYRLCVAKLMLFSPDGEREERYLAAGEAAGVVTEVLAELAPGAVFPAPHEVYLPPDCPQPGRKRLALLLLERIK